MTRHSTHHYADRAVRERQRADAAQDQVSHLMAEQARLAPLVAAARAWHASLGGSARSTTSADTALRDALDALDGRTVPTALAGGPLDRPRDGRAPSRGQDGPSA